MTEEEDLPEARSTAVEAVDKGPSGCRSRHPLRGQQAPTTRKPRQLCGLGHSGLWARFLKVQSRWWKCPSRRPWKGKKSACDQFCTISNTC